MGAEKTCKFLMHLVFLGLRIHLQVMANTLITQLNNPVVLKQLNQRLATVASVLLIIACAWLLVKITWMFFPQSEDISLAAPQNVRPLVSPSNQQNNFNKLTTANVFGVSEKVVLASAEKAPETRLNLTLKGVLASVPMAKASSTSQSSF